MKVERFIEIMEECYAPYPSMLKDMVARWLARKPDYYVSILSKVILETHSTKFKTPPGIADFAEAEKEVWSNLEYTDMKNKQLQIEAPTEKSQAGIEFLAMLTSKMAKGINPRTDSEIQSTLENLENNWYK